MQLGGKGDVWMLLGSVGAVAKAFASHGRTSLRANILFFCEEHPHRTESAPDHGQLGNECQHPANGPLLSGGCACAGVQPPPQPQDSRPSPTPAPETYQQEAVSRNALFPDILVFILQLCFSSMSVSLALCVLSLSVCLASHMHIQVMVPVSPVGQRRP